MYPTISTAPKKSRKIFYFNTTKIKKDTKTIDSLTLIFDKNLYQIISLYAL